jgi:hypothetical protein
MLQEELDQAALFRQIAASTNGVPGPVHRNVIPEFDEELETEHVEAKHSFDDTPIPNTSPAEPAPPAPPAEPTSPAVTTAQDLIDSDKTSFRKQLLGMASAAMMAAALGSGVTQYCLQPSAPEEPVAETTAPEVSAADQQLLDLLAGEDFTRPSTALSRTAAEQYEYDAALRDRHLQELQRAFDQEPESDGQE